MQSLDELRHVQTQIHTISHYNKHFNGMHDFAYWHDRVWYLSVPKSFFDDARTAGPFEFMVAIGFSFEYVLTNLLFVPFMSGALKDNSSRSFFHDGVKPASPDVLGRSIDVEGNPGHGGNRLFLETQGDALGREQGDLLFSGPVEEILAKAKIGQVVHIVVDDRVEEAAKLLAEVSGIMTVDITQDNGQARLDITIDPSSGLPISDLPSRLIAQGFRLSSMHQEKVNLEMAFMRLTKGLVS